MRYCRNCGKEIPEGTKFCPNCGTAVDVESANNTNQDFYQDSYQDTNQDSYQDTNQGLYLDSNQDSYQDTNQGLYLDSNQDPYQDAYNVNNRMESNAVLPIDRFGKFFGIILLIISLVEFLADPAFLKIVLSIAIICGCIFCLARKYKRKGLTIIALILAVICMLGGISQAKEVGLFRSPDDAKSEDVVTDYQIEIPEVSVTDLAKQETTKQDSNMPDSNKQDLAKQESNMQDSAKQDSTKQDSNKKGSANLETNKQGVTEIEENSDAEASENIQEDTTSVAESEENKEKVNGVDPELKEFLDSYEAFMDEYVDFMKKYSENPENAIGMLAEYSKIISKYEEFAKAVDAYDSDEMSTEDAKYYLEVINRCNQKLLEIY